MPPAQRPAEPPIHEVADDYALAFLLHQPGLLDALVAEHVDDGRGDCAACPGPQSGRRRWARSLAGVQVFVDRGADPVQGAHRATSDRKASRTPAQSRAAPAP
ncbi:hypothetical protein [Pseudonocardia sp. NPDC046786]|uniref:hypothetical protein n=1 Tax=Pseudonocardia sp. NPDC046786 TaxID=3155471 RepID=UPI0034114BE8